MHRSKLTGLDFLRALACGLVLVHHLVQRIDLRIVPPEFAGLFRFGLMGSFGVGIFFVLSGFLLARPYWSAYFAGTAMPGLAHYALRRGARIVPAYYLALVVSFILSITVFGFGANEQLIVRLVAGLLFINSFHPVTFFPVEVNGPLWSIGLEVVSYVLLPVGMALVFLLRGRLPYWRGTVGWLAVIGLAILAHWLIVRFMPVEMRLRGWEYGLIGGAKTWMPFYNVAAFFIMFAAGVLACGLSMLIAHKRVLFDGLAIVGLAGAGFVIWQYAPTGQSEGLGLFGVPYGFPGFTGALALTIMCLPHCKLLPRLTEARPFVFFAQISFGVYIWHFVVIEVLRVWVDPAYIHGGIRDFGTFAWFVLSVCVVTIAIAKLSWSYFERPILDRARFGPSPPATPTDDVAQLTGRS